MSNFFHGLKIAIPIGLAFWLTLLFVIIPRCAHAAPDSGWSTETKLEEVLYQTLHVIDTSQTVYIAKHPGQFYEKESAFAIGPHPTEPAVIRYMAADAIVHVAVTAALVKLNAPRWLTRTWELATIGDSARCVVNNFRIGIKVKF